MNLPNQFVCECRERSTYLKHVAAPVFRKSFQIESEASQGEVLICGLGFYDIFINGMKITKGLLAPYVSNPDHIVYYDRYDVTSYLKRGENVIGIMLGDGFLNSKTRVWDFMDNVFNSAPKLAVSVSIQDETVKKEFFATDFSCKKGPIVFNDLRSGIFYDKRLEEKGWKEPGFIEDESWHAPILADRPRGKQKICEAEPVIVTREVTPIDVRAGRLAEYEPREDVPGGLFGQEPQEGKPVREGGYIFDFGENNAGIFRLKIKGKPGQRIDIQCGEQLEDGAVSYLNINFFPDGYAQRDIYIVGSEEEEIFEPMFTYHGYRYLYVSGITEEQATKDLLTYLVMSSKLEERGSFSCSDQLSNRIFEACKRSDSSNFFYFPIDCPQREKNGWTGDAQASAEHMILTMGAENSWREWLNNIRYAQKENGVLPGVVPTDTFAYTWGNGPAWDKVLFELPYIIWKYRGETEVIIENAHAMLRYLEYVSGKRDEDGIVAIGLGDWVPVGRESSDYQAPLGFTDSVMIYDMCRKATEMFEAVNLSLHKEFAQQLGYEFLEAVRKRYVDTKKMLIKSACQTAQAMGIYYNIFTSGEKTEAFQRLMEIIRRDDKKITSGFQGLRVIFHVLSEFGEYELAYEMITGPKYPSYGYYVENGYTTMPEQFFELDDKRMFMMSQNHHFLCDIVQWYMKYPGGICVHNSKKVSIQPKFLKGLSYAEASHCLPDGEVKVQWKRNGEKIHLDVVCPENVFCEVVLDNYFCFEESGDFYMEQGSGCFTILDMQNKK